MISGVKRAMGRFTAGFEKEIDDLGASGMAMAVAKFYPGGMPALLDRLREAGHGRMIDSWIDIGPNQGLLVEALAEILPQETARAIAWDLGVPQKRLAAVLSQFLPAAVDRESPGGTLRAHPRYDAERILEARSDARNVARDAAE